MAPEESDESLKVRFPSKNTSDVLEDEIACEYARVLKRAEL
jgi:hypothetical protein